MTIKVNMTRQSPLLNEASLPKEVVAGTPMPITSIIISYHIAEIYIVFEATFLIYSRYHIQNPYYYFMPVFHDMINITLWYEIIEVAECQFDLGFVDVR